MECPISLGMMPVLDLLMWFEAVGRELSSTIARISHA